jgi:hypothetical protein
MYVHGEILEDVMGALDARSFFPFGLFEEQFDACFKFRVESAQFSLHHHDNLVVMLHPQSSFFQRMEGISKRADLYFSYCALKLLKFDFFWSLFKHVDPGDQQDIGEAVS